MKMRFIGGSNDGALIAVPNNRYTFELPVKNKVFPCSWDREDFVPGAIDYKTERYNREKISGDKETFECFLLHDMSPDAMIESLLDNYHPSITE